jgi:hypothetical protein
MTGLSRGSITRVQSVLYALLGADPTGQTWLPCLIPCRRWSNTSVVRSRSSRAIPQPSYWTSMTSVRRSFTRSVLTVSETLVQYICS